MPRLRAALPRVVPPPAGWVGSTGRDAYAPAPRRFAQGGAASGGLGWIHRQGCLCPGSAPLCPGWCRLRRVGLDPQAGMPMPRLRAALPRVVPPPAGWVGSTGRDAYAPAPRHFAQGGAASGGLGWIHRQGCLCPGSAPLCPGWCRLRRCGLDPQAGMPMLRLCAALPGGVPPRVGLRSRHPLPSVPSVGSHLLPLRLFALIR